MTDEEDEKALPDVELEEDDEDPEDEEVVVADPAAVETSFDEILSKKIAEEDDEEEDLLLDLTREERLESLAVKTTPKQANEFVCRSCHLVKHHSQLADKKRELCRDCV